jgi:transposase
VTSELACPVRAGWNDVIVPRPYPREFREDVVRVARSRDDGVAIEQIATDFGVHPMTLTKWLRQADVDDGAEPGVSRAESAKLGTARRRIKLLEQENEAFADGNGRTTRLLADLVFASAQDSDPVLQYDWNVDKASYINLLRRYDTNRDVTDLARLLEARPIGE